MLSLGKFFVNKFKRDDTARVSFYEDFADALEDNIAPKDRLLKLLKRAKKNKNTDAYIYEHMVSRLNHTSFAKSLHGCVPESELMVLIAAERDGKLVDAMRFLGKGLRIISKIKGVYVVAMLSPAVGILVMLASFVVNAKYLGPMNLKLMPLHKWPSLTRALFEFSLFFTNNLILCISCLLGIVLLVSWSKSNWVGSLRNRCDKVPFLPWKSFRDRSADMFLMSLAMMVQTRSFSFKEALEGMRQSSSPWMAWHLNRMLWRFPKSPENPAKALDTGLFSRPTLDRLEDFASGSAFEHGLKKISIDNSDKKLDAATKHATLSAFGLIGVVALFIGLMAASQFQFNSALESSIGRMRY